MVSIFAETRKEGEWLTESFTVYTDLISTPYCFAYLFLIFWNSQPYLYFGVGFIVMYVTFDISWDWEFIFTTCSPDDTAALL